MKRTLIALFSLMLMTAFFAVITSEADAATYIGAAKCKICHMKEFKAWQATTMANSFENLKPGVKAAEKKKAKLDPNKDYTNDPKCLKCHTTGYGQPGGFKSLADTPDLINVQCEGCHGPGSEYLNIMKTNKEFKRADAKAAGLTIPSEDEKGCMSCHGMESPFNEKVDAKYKFNFKEKLKGTHEHFPLKYQH
ncbi:MAG: hypothetical protein HY756_08695 [Nitrospirae bacterium]|nr:hypothetical protein [Nitrospirota bacterium]